MTADAKRKDLLDRVNKLPDELLDEVAAILDEAVAFHDQLPYHPTPEELAAIDRGLAEADAGHFASPEAVEEALAKFRR